MTSIVRTAQTLFDLRGRTALVTGGARGIGRAIAGVLIGAGARVAILDIDEAEARNCAAELNRSAGAEAIALQADVTKPEELEEAVRRITAVWDRLDIAFCNAGICLNIPAEDMTPEEWMKVISINLSGVFYTAQAAGRQMIRQGQGGSIITTASMSAHIVNVPQPQCSYNASKAAVIQLSRSLAIEWAEHGIRVNSISPGYIGTELTLNSEALKPLIPQWIDMSPSGRLGRPEELQGIALYLASDASSYTTGSDFIVDGGFTSI